MGRERLKLKDKVQMRLYDKNGQLKVGSPKKRKSKVDKVLKFLLDVLEEEPG